MNRQQHVRRSRLRTAVWRSVEVALLCYLKKACGLNWLFIPWTTWLTALALWTLWQSASPPKLVSMPSMERVQNRYRRHEPSDTELLLPQA